MNGAFIRNKKLLINWTFHLGWPDRRKSMEQYNITAQYFGIPNKVSSTVCCPRLIMSNYNTSKFWTVLLLFVDLVISQHSMKCSSPDVSYSQWTMARNTVEEESADVWEEEARKISRTDAVKFEFSQQCILGFWSSGTWLHMVSQIGTNI